MHKNDIEALKASHPILEVLQMLGIDVRNHRFRCPRPQNHTHGDRTPSVTVWPDRGQFKCWVCADVQGDVIDLIRLSKGCSFREALEFLGGSRVEENRADRNPRPEVAPHRSAASEQSELGVEAHPTEDKIADAELRKKILTVFLDLCSPVGGKVARYLQRRRIFKRTWDKQALKMVDDYAGISRHLSDAFRPEELERSGFFNSAGHLRYYRHRLLFPYFDRGGHPVYLQARAIEDDVKPKELSLAGTIPMPYNCRLLNEEPGQIYLCEGVIDSLTLIEQGFPAVGVPGASHFKLAWAPLFKNKTVHVVFDPDAPGESGAAKAIDMLMSQGIEARRLAPPTGKDINDWFRRG